MRRISAVLFAAVTLLGSGCCHCWGCHKHHRNYSPYITADSGFAPPASCGCGSPEIPVVSQAQMIPQQGYPQLVAPQMGIPVQPSPMPSGPTRIMPYAN